MKYPKIQTVYLRNPETKYKTLLEGQFSCPEFEYLATNEWLFTEKIDGTNIRVNWDGEQVVFQGRTDKAQMPPFLLKKLQKMLPSHKFSWHYPDTPMLLYGEGYGARIQKGGGNYISDDVSFILFDVMVNGFFLQRKDIEDIANHLEIDAVPIVGSGTLAEGIEIAHQGFQSKIGSQVAEGLVMRPVVDLFSRRGNRVIAKIKYKDFQR